MKRRTLLATLGTGVAGLSGCAGVLGGSGDPVETLTPVTVPPTETPTETPPGTPTDGGTNGVEPCRTADGPYDMQRPAFYDPPEAPDRFDNLGCPSFEWAARTVCHHTADLDSEDVLLLTDEARATIVSPRSSTLKRSAEVSFTLMNSARQTIRVQPESWSVLEQYNDGRWYTKASGEPGCTLTLDREGYHRWRLGIGVEPDAPEVNVTAGQASLDAGTYVFAVPVLLPDERDILCAAPFFVRKRSDGLDVITPHDDFGFPDGTETANGTYLGNKSAES